MSGFESEIDAFLAEVSSDFATSTTSDEREATSVNRRFLAGKFHNFHFARRPIEETESEALILRTEFPKWTERWELKLCEKGGSFFEGLTKAFRFFSLSDLLDLSNEFLLRYEDEMKELNVMDPGYTAARMKHEGWMKEKSVIERAMEISAGDEALE